MDAEFRSLCSSRESDAHERWAPVRGYYDELRRGNDPWRNKFRIMMYIEPFAKGIYGQKRVIHLKTEDGVIIQRARLGYELHVTVYFDDQKNGFDLSIPSTGLLVRVTSKPPDAPPFDLLVRTICKIDESVIRARGKKWQPLEYHLANVDDWGLKHVPSAESHVISKPTTPLPPK
jgi:hypothetical protein